MWLILSIFCDVPGQEPPNTVIKFIAANFCLCVREEYTLEELEVLVDGVKFALVLRTGEDEQIIEVSSISTTVKIGEEYSLFINMNQLLSSHHKSILIIEAWH